MKLEKIMDVGTDNPIVARLGPGMHDIIQMAQIEEIKKQLIVGICLQIMQDLVEAEKAAKPLMDELRLVEEDIKISGVKTQSNGRVIEHPSILRINDSKVFLKFAKQAIQKLASFFELIFDEKYSGPHFHKIEKKALTFFGKDHVVYKLLKEDQSWIKDIIDLRNEDEHPKTGKPFVTGYDISRLEDGRFFIKLPRFYNDIQLLNGLETYSHNLLTFCEEMIAHTLEHYFPQGVKIYTIPEDKRDSELPVRFHIGLSNQNF